MAVSAWTRRAVRVAGAGAVLLLSARTGAIAEAASPGAVALARRLAARLGTAPLAARLALPVEHRAIALAAIAFLMTAAGIETTTRLRVGRRRGRRAIRAVGPSLDVASAAGTQTIALSRARAHPVQDGEGHLVAQVVWSHDLGWCAEAAWPHFLYGPEGLPRQTAALRDDVWLHVAGVGLRVRRALGARADAARTPRPPASGPRTGAALPDARA